MQVRRMRKLREKHNITINQLARLSPVNRQRLTQIELGDGRVTEHMRNLVKSAFVSVVEQRRRQLADLETDFLQYRDRLLDYIDEEEKP